VKNSPVIKFSKDTDKICDIGFDKIFSCQSEKNAPYNLEGICRRFSRFENPENKVVHIVLGDLKFSETSKMKENQLHNFSTVMCLTLIA
jgi:hypothetical protein